MNATDRLGKPVAVGLSALLLAWAAILFVVVMEGAARRGHLGWDTRLYASFGARFLQTGDPYFAVQFAGPYSADGIVNLYPPNALYLFVPFAVLPLALWWAIPLGILGWHLWRCRPAAWTWPVMALIVGLVPTVSALAYGNTILWSAAFVALGLRWPAVGALLAMKPTDAVAWLLFARRRAFWAGLGVMAAAALPFGGLWLEWIAALGNLEGWSPLRNVTSLPVLAFPVVAWLGRARPDDEHLEVVASGSRAPEAVRA